MIGDPAGHANLVNDGGEFTVANLSTPTSEPSLDLRRLELARIRSAGGTTGLTLTMTTSGDLRDRTQLTLKTRTASCPDILLRYVHGAAEPLTVLSSGCSSGARSLVTRVAPRSVTVTVPFSALPERARNDRLLGTLNAFSQIHLAGTPLSPQAVGSSMVDRTLQDVAYRMR